MDHLKIYSLFETGIFQLAILVCFQRKHGYQNKKKSHDYVVVSNVFMFKCSTLLEEMIQFG